jgi:hypothetical protein
MTSMGYLPIAGVDTAPMIITGAMILFVSLVLGSIWLRHKNASLDAALLLGTVFGGTFLRGILLIVMGSGDDLLGVPTARLATYTSLWQASTLLLTSAVWGLLARTIRSVVRRSPQSRNDSADRAIVLARGLAAFVPVVMVVITYKMLVTGAFLSTACGRGALSGEVVSSGSACGDPVMWYTYVPGLALGACSALAALVTDRSKWAPANNATSFVAGSLMAIALGVSAALASSDSISPNLGALLFLTLENCLWVMVALVVNANLEIIDGDATGVELMGVYYAVTRESQREIDQATAATAIVSLGAV